LWLPPCDVQADVGATLVVAPVMYRGGHEGSPYGRVLCRGGHEARPYDKNGFQEVISMGSAIQSMVLAAAGTGATTYPNSRYYGTPVEYFTRPDGVQVAYLQRRIIPQPGIYTSTRNYAIVDGDRLDNLASKFLGSPFLYWTICDANGATDPDEVTAQIGKTILIPLASGIPSGARNG